VIGCKTLSVARIYTFAARAAKISRGQVAPAVLTTTTFEGFPRESRHRLHAETLAADDAINGLPSWSLQAVS